MSLFHAEARVEAEMLVAFADLTHYARFSMHTDPSRVADILDAFYALVASRVASAGGVVVKTIGDAMLLAFPSERADDGVRALMDAKPEVDDFLRHQGWDSRVVIKAHVGPVVAGPLGPPGCRRFDVIGHTVNVAATLEVRDLALSAQAFRKLSPETRRRFRKHTPPITYVPVERA